MSCERTKINLEILMYDSKLFHALFLILLNEVKPKRTLRKLQPLLSTRKCKKHEDSDTKG